MNRREFIRLMLAGSGAVCASSLLKGNPVSIANSLELSTSSSLSWREAMHYQKRDEKMVRCDICPRHCEVADKERGYCGCRENKDGTYYTLVYGRPCSVHIDPVEKKPLFHFFPSTKAFSLATAGCNMLCKFCQNWQISQVRPEQVDNLNLPPEKLVPLAKMKGAKSIAFTYTEPVVFFEYVYETARLTKGSDIKTISISNGYITEQALEDWCRYLDAMKVDLKAFTDSFYKNYCAGTLQPVLDCLKLLVERKVWTEIVYLVIPTLNDQIDDIRKMAKWIVKELGVDVPVHFTRFHPMYQLQNLPSTPVSTLERARKACMEEGIRYVYVGNVPGHDAENTYCHNCKKKLIARYGYYITENNITDGKCKFCETKIPGVWG